MSSEWDNSISKSRIIDNWMDEYVYSSTGFTDFVRYEYTDNPELQNSGVDVTFTLNGMEYICDEKCAAEKVNQPLKTFAFALSQTNKNDRSVRHYDWFLSDDMKNDSYMIQYIDEAYNEDGTEQNKYTLTKDGIKKVTLILIRKEKIFEYLAEHKLTKDKLFKANDYMLSQSDSFFPKKIIKNGIKCNDYKFGWVLHRDFTYEERTVNVLIKKSVLIKISDWYSTIVV